jgi:hypothetical protein
VDGQSVEAACGDEQVFSAVVQDASGPVNAPSVAAFKLFVFEGGADLEAMPS